MSDVVYLASKTLSIDNKEAEEQILGGILLKNNLLDAVSGMLEPHHFSYNEHAEIYRLCRELIRSGKTANPVTLKSLVSFKEVAGQTPVQYLMSLCKNPASAMTIEDYAKLIVNLYGVRELRRVAEETMFETGKPGTPRAASVADMIRERLEEIEAGLGIVSENPMSIAEITEDCLLRLDRIRSGKIEAAPSTGLKDLDNKISGWFPGRFYVVGGRPGQGKTVFGINAAYSLVRRRKPNGSHYGAIYFTLEVSYEDIWSRFVSRALATTNSPIPYRSMQEHDALSDVEFERVMNTAADLKNLPLTVIDKPGLTVAKIEDYVRRIKQAFANKGQTLDVVFIDYLGLIKASDRYKGFRVHEIAEISAGLVSIAKRHKIAVVALAQLSRGVEGRESKIPNMADLRDSGAIEQDANSVMFLCRPAYYEAQAGEDLDPENLNKMLINVDKSRDGTTGVINVYEDVSCSYLADKARGF